MHLSKKKRRILMSKQRTLFSPEFKMQVVLESFNINITLADLAKKHATSVKNILNWKQQFLKNAHLSFDAATSKNQLESLKKENEKLEKLLMKLQLEKNDAVKKLNKLDISVKKQMIDTSLSSLSISQQCKLIGLNRPSLYYAPRPSKKNDETIMERICEIFKTDATSYGYRTMHQILIKEGYKIGVNKVHKLMKLLEEEKGIKPISKKIDTEKEPIQHSHILHDLALAKPFN